MSYHLTEMLSRSFLENFNYCNVKGKRSRTNLLSKLFLDITLTEELEHCATSLTRAVEDTWAQARKNDIEKVDEVLRSISDVVTIVTHRRKQYGDEYHEGDGTHERAPTYGTDMLVLKKPGQFEKELKAGLKSMLGVITDTVLNPENGQIDLPLYQSAADTIKKIQTKIDETPREVCTRSWAN